MKWPDVDITITRVPVKDSSDNVLYYKEARVYEVKLNGDERTMHYRRQSAVKLTNGFRRIVPGLPHNGVYNDCDGSTTSLENYLCYQDVGIRNGTV